MGWPNLLPLDSTAQVLQPPRGPPLSSLRVFGPFTFLGADDAVPNFQVKLQGEMNCGPVNSILCSAELVIWGGFGQKLRSPSSRLHRSGQPQVPDTDRLGPSVRRAGHAG